MIIILGAGLAGLSAGLRLTRAGKSVAILEKGKRVGGLAQTVSHGDFHFDLGGHRFLTDNKDVELFVTGLLGEDLLRVPRKSRIYLGRKYVDYPLTPINAIFGLGLSNTINILIDYGREKVRNAIPGRKKEISSLKDWVVSNYGLTMFNLYFKEYSEKVWGINCQQISMEWVSKRIDGLSLWQAIVHALFKVSGRRLKTLSDTFFYPRQGIGQLADRMHAGIAQANSVQTEAEVERVCHEKGKITGVQFKNGQKTHRLQGSQYLSSIPVTKLLQTLDPKPPDFVLDAAARISFRSLVVVALMINRERVTDLTWMYLPEKNIPFGRIHEPKNWSSDMAPQGKTHIVAEYFCDREDRTWNTNDAELTASTAHHLQRLNFFQSGDVIDSHVCRIPYAYPVFSIDYQEHLKIITDYINRFSNLHLIGRSGMFRYLNMDLAMESGLDAADKIIRNQKISKLRPKNIVSTSNSASYANIAP